MFVLPDDLIRQCLLRVPYKSHYNLKAVCKKWKDIISSPEFYKERLTSGTSDHLICMIQNLKRPPPGSYNILSTCRVIVLDPLRRTWEMLRPIPDFPLGFPLHCECICVNGKLVLMGGRHPENLMETLNRVYIFDFVSAQWRRGANMSTPRIGFACSLSSTTGLIYVAGGRRNQNARQVNDFLATAEVYNVEEDRWEILPPMSQALGRCHGVFLGEEFFVFSQNGNNSEIYDPRTGMWRLLDDMWRSVSSFRMSSLVASGQLYTFNERQLMKYDVEKNDWVVQTFLHTELCEAILCEAGCTAEWRGVIFLSQRCNSSNRRVCSLLNPSSDELIELCVPKKLDGFATSAATVQI